MLSDLKGAGLLVAHDAVGEDAKGPPRALHMPPSPGVVSATHTSSSSSHIRPAQQSPGAAAQFPKRAMHWPASVEPWSSVVPLSVVPLSALPLSAPPLSGVRVMSAGA